ncbi:MAG: GerAB/ArcD/ProY family transporter [Clostridia bacterium]|nr:GerAB/ArcD/ProY family transporter [Clostridia bacterium]
MKISYRQLCIMVFLSLISMKFLVLPSVLYRFSENMSWLVVLVLMIIDGLYVFLIIDLMKKNPYRNIHEFMIHTIGPVLTKIFLGIISIQLALQIANMAKGSEFFVVENFYNNFNWMLYVLPLIALTGFMIYKGIRNIARVQEIFCWAIIIGCIYIVIKSINGVDPLEYLPMFKDGVEPLFYSGFRHMNWFGSSSFLLLLFGKVDFKDERKGKLISYIVIAIVLVQILYFIFFGLFGVTSPTHTFAISDISQFSSSKSIIDELSWLVVSLWVIAEAMQIAVYGYCLVQAIMFIIGKKWLIPTICLLEIGIFALGYIGAETIYMEYIFFTPFASIITVISQYIIPLVLVVGNFLRNRKKRVVYEKTQINI